MTTPRTPVKSRTGIFIPFIILSNYEDEDTTLPVVYALLSSDYVPASPDYSLNSDSDSEPTEYDSPDEDLTENAESLQTQTALTPEIPLPPSATSPYLPTLSLLPSSSRKRSRSPSLPLPSVSPPPAVSSPAPAAVAMAYIEQETMTLRARVKTLEQQDIDSQMTNILEITELRSRVEYVETHLEQSHARHTRYKVRLQRAEMTRQDVKALHARAEAVEQQAKTLQASLGAAQMDSTDLLESR
ncbi:hypothetical protein Tco_0730539 [Tanacetum coccineum]|uniref:Uncharacterized protein n=1 Tax=Tanacetum coccineum TaxID=301880 RepID=A0ABQ4YV37_9ASTR